MTVHSTFTGMASPEGGLVAIENDLDEDDELAIARMDDWANQNGFLFVSSYWSRFPDNPEIIVNIWVNPSGTYFAHYLARPEHLDVVDCCDFVSLLCFNNAVSLTSSNSDSGGMIPAQRGVLGQSFPGIDTDELFARHNRGLEFVKERLGLTPLVRDEDVGEHITMRIHDDANFVMSHFLWPVRGLVWFVRRKKYHRIPVWHRYAKLKKSDIEG